MKVDTIKTANKLLMYAEIAEEELERMQVISQTAEERGAFLIKPDQIDTAPWIRISFEEFDGMWQLLIRNQINRVQAAEAELAKLQGER